MKYNTIITDLDRTLLRTDKTLSTYTVYILKKCKQKGMNIIAASARPLRNVIPINEIINFDSLVVSNGAKIIKEKNIIEHKIPFESGKKVIDLLNSNDLEITIETGKKAYSNVKLDYFETHVTNNLIEVLKNEGALKIVISIKDSETYNLINSVLDDNIYCTIANNYVIQIMNKKATKWNGIKKILKLNNLDSKECIYFGDDNDDVTPLQKCGLGVCPENAIDECKQVSDYICKSNDEDGVAHFIEEFILKEEK